MTMINIVFPKGIHERLVINSRSSGKDVTLYIYVSSKLTGSRRRYIHFKNQYGSGVSCRNFITEQLNQCASTWKSHDTTQRWCEDYLDGLKIKIESGWEYHLKKLPKNVQDHQEMKKVCRYAIRQARRDTTVSISLHGF